MKPAPRLQRRTTCLIPVSRNWAVKIPEVPGNRRPESRRSSGRSNSGLKHSHLLEYHLAGRTGDISVHLPAGREHTPRAVVAVRADSTGRTPAYQMDTDRIDHLLRTDHRPESQLGFELNKNFLDAGLAAPHLVLKIFRRQFTWFILTPER